MKYLATRLGVNPSWPRIFIRAFGIVAAAAFAVTLIAQNASWKTKPPAQWTEDDVAQVLSASPWAREIRADIARRQTEEELREGGQMGQPRGFGYDHVDDGVKGYTPSIAWLNIFTGKGGEDRSPRSRPRPGSFPLGLRWESALPVKLAKLKSANSEAMPVALDDEGYQIAVYGVPDSDAAKGDPRKTGEPFKGNAALKREGKKDVRPSRVEVFRREGGPVIIYLFPLSAEITKKDAMVQFEAHIGRIEILQAFDITQMEFLGKLEL
jgi:hypothetical protein